MVAKQGLKRKRIKPRNPLAPAVRRLRPKVEPSTRAYKRKPKHKAPNTVDDSDA